MGFRLRIKYFLVHTLNYTNKNANKIIASGALSINGKIIVQNETMRDEDEVSLNGNVIRARPVFKYYAVNKPVGLESTLNKNIKDNLTVIFPLDNTFSIAGRLDKASEGLLLVSNDGKWVNKMARPESKKEKEYEVEVNKEVTKEFVEAMKQGVNIGFYITQPCELKKTGPLSFIIVLTEGKNKQIRRMCQKLGYGVTGLKRIRIDKFYLDDLQGFTIKELKI